MRAPLLAGSLIAAALGAAVLASEPAAQTRPAVPLVFDDFAYPSRAALLAPSRWATDLDAPPAGGACTTGAGCERLWYLGNWRDEGAGGTRVAMSGPSAARFETLPGDTLRWGAPVGHPPLIQSGFMASTGTWVAGVRLDDIRRANARRGRAGVTPMLADAFWTISPHYASRTAGYDHVFWSELNHEWNNYFYAPRRDPADLSTAIQIDQFMAAGLTLDGECQGLCDTGVATGGLFMSDPVRPSAPALTCREWRQGRTGATRDAYACQDAFAQGLSVLLLQYDGRTMRWAAAVEDPQRDGAWLWMALDLPVGRRAQPMTAMFSRIMAPPSFCKATGNPESLCEPVVPGGFDVDWFLYSPATTLSVWDAIGGVAWLRDRGHARVNTTALRLAASTAPAPESSYRFLTPATVVSGARPEWTFLPPLPWAGAGTPRLSWDVRWRWRGRRDRSSGWTAWQSVDDGGFSIDHPVSGSWERVEVEVTARDWHPIGAGGPIVACRSLQQGAREAPCEPR